ncbi:hypothetical protein CSH63_04200 [Micromonospora tulbaghiae]|uniref:Uncharacterized protein n=1 Tax=Micromonospora tulbaghiae TaxID=479978 RepID=A0A386WGP8_9ACTN|nr:hypothetical protein CSH63_04200 [Micromonospora tulbaghiae]
MLRGLLGEAYLIDLVDEKAAALIMYSMLFWLVHELGLSEEQIDDLITAADELADRPVRVSGSDGESTLDLRGLLNGNAMRWRPLMSPKCPNK